MSARKGALDEYRSLTLTAPIGAPTVRQGSLMRLAIALLYISALGRAADPDPVELARRSIAFDKINQKQARQYAYRQYKVTRSVDRNGNETARETETWDVIGLEGSSYRKLVMKNDRPLPPKLQKQEDERLRKETERRQKETPEERRKRTFSFSYSYAFPYSRLIDIFDLHYAGEEEIEGQRFHVVEGMPKPGFLPKTDDEKETLNYKVKLWLEPADCAFVRMELDIIGDHSRMQKGSLIRVDGIRLDDGVWMTAKVTFDYTARFFKTLTEHGQMVMTLSDFHKFHVDSRILDGADKY